MESREKVNFIFAAYDFSGGGELSYDESLLLFRSVAKGISKTCPGQAEVLFGASTIQEVLDTKIDGIVTNAMNDCLTLDALQAYSSSHPVTNSWLNFCTQFMGEEVAASEDVVSKVFDSSTLSQDITFTPTAYVPYTDYMGVEEVKEETPEDGSKAEEGSNVEVSQEVTEESKETVEEAGNEGEAKDEGASLLKKNPKVKNSLITPWMNKAMLFKPDEMPAPRSDDPTDIFDLTWLHGVSGANGFSDSVIYTANHNVVYAASNYVVVASMAAAEGDGEEAEEGAPPSGTWSQKVYRQHAHPVSALAVNTKKTQFASADVAAAGETSEDPTKIIVWDASTITPAACFVTAREAGVGVRSMDFSKDGRLLLALMNDMHNTINIYDIESGTIIFTVRHGNDEMVANACFTGSPDVFIVAGSKGATFYVNEGNNFLAGSGFTKYERRIGLLGSFAAQFTGTSVIQTNVCRFEFADEAVTGTAAGEIIFWHGRNCVQVLKAFESDDAVSRLTFNADSGVIAASSAAGRIALFKLSAGTIAPATGVTKAGPKVPLVRQLEPAFSFDLMHLGAARPVPVSLSLHDNGERCLIGTRSGDVYELSLKPQLPPGAEGAGEGDEGGDAPAEPAEGEEEAAPAGEGEAAQHQSKPTYGAILWGGPIGTGHFSSAGNNTLAVTGLCPNGTEAFISCGADGAVRSYDCKEGGTNKIIAESFCDSGCVTVTASPTLAAVSMDGSVVPNRLGTVQILSLPDLKFVTEFKESEEKVSLLRFNAEGTILLTCTLTVKLEKGSEEGKTTTTSTIRSYGLVKEEGEEVEKWTLKDSSLEIFGEISSIDYSADGTYIRCSNLTTDRLQIFQAVPSETVGFGTEIKGEAIRALGAGYGWATNSCALSWDTLGAFNTLKGDFVSLIKQFNDDWEAELENAATAPAPAEAEGEGGDEEEKDELEAAAAAAAKSLSTVIDEDDVTNGPGLLAKLGSVARSQHLFLSSGKAGTVTVTRVPAFEALELEPEVGSATFAAHRGRISAMAFVGEAGERLVTAGADDGLIMVWKVTYDVSEPEGEGGDEPEAPEGDDEEGGAAGVDDGYESAEEEDLFDGDRLLDHLTAKKPSKEKLSAVKDWVDYVGRTKEDMPATGFETMPNDELALDWVYGYAARSTRGAVKYDGEGRIIYPASSLGVVFDKAKSAEQTEKQSYFMSHSDEITAMDVHAGSGIAASGNKGCGDISVYLWDTATQKTLRRLSCGVVRAISAIAFSPSGSHVAVACQDDSHTVKLFEVKSGNLVAATAGGALKVLGLTFSMAKSGPMRLLQHGVKHFRVLEYDGALAFTVKVGRFGMKKMDVNAACALPLPLEGGNEFLLGLSNGFVAFLPLGELNLAGAQPVLVATPVTAMVCAVLKEATAEEPAFYKVAVAGGRSKIKFVGSELEVLQEVDLSTDDYGLVKGGNVRGFKSLATDKAMRKLLYGTSGGEIGEIDFESGMDMNEGKPLVYSHFKDSLRAMQQHPIRQEALTAGGDKTLRVWDLASHKMMTYVTLPDIASCACYAPNGQIICVGLGGTVKGEGRTNPRDFDGKVAIVSYLQGVLNIVHIAGDAKDTILDIAFSIDGARLYAASGDSNIYVYDALDNFKLTNTLKVHGDGVNSIDLSEDGKLMLTTGVDGEIITWDLTSETPSTLDSNTWDCTNWSHRNGPRGYNSTGLYPSFESQHVLTTCCSSRDFKLVAAGDVYGGIKLALSPAVSLDFPHKRYVAHSPGGVAKVAFTVEDQYFVSIGTDDRCLMQWKVAKSGVEPTKKTKTPAPKPEDEGTPLGNFADSFKEMGSHGVAPNPETSVPSVQALT
jgi:WD40 repeat protein